MEVDVVSAQAHFEASNNVQTTSSFDDFFRSDPAQDRKETEGKPWRTSSRCYTRVQMSALALLKLTMHARSGGNIEVMGILIGKVRGDTMVVLDAFALPVEGTETRVNAASEANAFLIDYIESGKRSGRLENAIGWYHSHPGYGCWLSGIDVSTQALNQQFQEPWLAVVVDPVQTMSTSKVAIGAFRTLSEAEAAQNKGAQAYQSVPMGKAEDFGAHAAKYYKLDMSFFKSSLDAHIFHLLFAKYWGQTLSSSPLTASRDYNSGRIADVAAKSAQHEVASARGGGARLHAHSAGHALLSAGSVASGSQQSDFALIAKDANKLASDHLNGMMHQLIKKQLFYN